MEPNPYEPPQSNESRRMGTWTALIFDTLRLFATAIAVAVGCAAIWLAILFVLSFWSWLD